MQNEVTSPFRPGQPVQVELFTGRANQVEKLLSKIARCRGGQVEVAFLVGERGIGKTSLAHFVQVLAETRYQIAGLHSFLGHVRTLEQMAQRVFDRLVKDSVDRPWHKAVVELFGKHVKSVGLFGVTLEFTATPEDLSTIVGNFVPALRSVIERLKDHNQGLLLILDDINGIASSAEFANWLKSIVDEIAVAAKPMPLFILLVGLDQRRQELIRAQPSLARVMDVIEIEPWSQDETREFFETAFAGAGVQVQPEALDLLAAFPGGLPVLAHEIGDAVFSRDSDGLISQADAVIGVRDAAEIVGRKYLEPQVLRAITSERYHSILGKIALGHGLSVRRQEMLDRLSSEEAKVFDNFLRRMKELGVLRATDTRGSYAFANRLHAAYFTLISGRQHAS